jgi:uroporphyrinogen decarboxylase
MSELMPLPPDFHPHWEDIRTALLGQGEPDWVPFVEGEIHPVHWQRILGRPVRSLADYLEVQKRLGQPFLAAELGLHTTDVVRDAIENHADAADKPKTERTWALGSGGVIHSEADLEAFPWPDPDDLDYGGLAERENLLPEGFKTVLVVGKVFNLGWWLMGMEGYAYALVDQPALIERLHARIAAFQERVIERALAFKSVGMVFHADDLAYRTGLMVSPEVLRQHIFPVYKRLNRLCHERDVITVFHSDGNVDRVVQDVIDAGFCALNPIEPVAMDIRALKQRVAGRLSLIGNVDLSYTLTMGTPEEVKAEVRELIRDLAPGGGYALSSANSIPDYVPWENFVALHAAWLESGRYPICV